MLLITVDCDDLLACTDMAQVAQIADAICTAQPDLFAMDIADNDRCHYPSIAGTTTNGVPMDALLAAGYDPYGLVVERLKAAGLVRVDHEQAAEQDHGQNGREQPEPTGQEVAALDVRHELVAGVSPAREEQQEQGQAG